MEEVSFEQALKSIEDIVELLEKGDLTLEQSLKAYEQGVALTTQCNNIIKDAQLKVEELKEGQKSE